MAEREEKIDENRILALQGAFVEHEKMLAQLGVESTELRNLEDSATSK